MRSVWRFVGFAVGLLLLVALAWVWTQHNRGRHSLAAYRAQLIAQGEKLSVSEVVTPPILADDPDYRRLMAAARLLKGRPIQPGSFDYAGRFAAPGELIPLDAITNLSISGSAVVTWSDWQAEVTAMQPTLAGLRQALRSPAPRSDFDYRVATVRGSDFVLRRQAAQWLAGETLAALHATNHAAAVESLQALLALTELHREDPTLLNQIIRVAISGLAFDVTCAALQSPDWTDAQLTRIQSAWERDSFFERLVTSMEGERAFMLIHFEQARTNSSSAVWNQRGPGAARPANVGEFLEDFALNPLYRHTWAEEDQRYFLQHYQDWIGAMRDARQHRSWMKLKVEIDRVFKPIEDSHGLDLLRHRFSLMAIPNWKRAMEIQLRGETQRSLCLAALALRRHELRHGRPPADLAALTPELLAATPVDFMVGQPLRYRVEDDGTWRLYSVGLDGKDDGGDSFPAQPWGKYQNVWDGRDAVWPRLASAVSLLPVIPSSEVVPIIQFDNVPLRDAIIALGRFLGLNLIFDPTIESTLNRPVKLRLENVSASDVLQLLLDQHRLRAARDSNYNLIGITAR